ncbi:glycosyltransferase family 10 domain-containing protein [Aestuariivirga sp.]|uniref:glycosyltransferase family 10 domain-containing protein n=1 Tax=Aestuariivirga sp. TaxID=2650926 RepID=UPI00391B01DB
MRVSYIFWEPWFRGQRPHLDLQGRANVVLGFSGIFDADVVVVHAPSLLDSGQRQNLEKLRRNSRPGQVWILVSQESSANYPDQFEPSFASLFDGEMSHRQTADVWIPYLGVSIIKGCGEMETGGRDELCCAFISSGVNKSGREAYLAELMKHIEIASYGRYQNNRRLPGDTGRDTKLRLMKSFTYAIAFENSLEEDYVTEKFFDPISVGTIPVYLGAPNAGEFYPGDECCIDASDHPDPRRMAQMMLQSDARDFHRWRGKPLRQSFVKKLERLSIPFHERFIAAVETLLDSKR